VHRARERRAVDTRARATGAGDDGGGGGGARAGENANPPSPPIGCPSLAAPAPPGSRLGPFPLRYTRRDSR